MTLPYCCSQINRIPTVRCFAGLFPNPFPGPACPISLLAIFQKWARNHAPRSSSSPSSGAAAAATAAVTATASYASAAAAAAATLGPRTSYHERAASASPLHRQWLRKKREAWADGEGDGGGGRGGDGEQDGAEGEGLGGSSDPRRIPTSRGKDEESEREREMKRDRERERREREQEEEKRRDKVDRAFRTWLDRKKKQAQAEREAQRRREEALTKLRYVLLHVCMFMRHILLRAPVGEEK